MDEWQEVALDDVATLNGGFAFKSSQYTESGRFVLRTVNITDDFAITKEGATYISEREAAEYGRFALREHDTLFVMVAATLGKVGYVRSKDLPALLNQNMWVIRARANKIEPVFLHYAFREISKIPLSWVGGSARSFLRRDDVRTLRFKLPPPPEQRAIANVLAALDDKIELNRRMNETLEGMAQAIFRDWFVDFGPVRRKAAGEADPVAVMGGLTADPARAAQLAALFPAAFGNDGLPVGWNEEPLLDQAHWINGAAYKNMHFVPKGLGLPVIKIAELKAGVSDQTKFTSTDLGQKYRINDGELLFSWSGNPDTSIDAFVWTGGRAWLNQHIFAVRENGKMDIPTLHTMLKWLMPQFAELARNKQTTGLGHVTKDDMKRLLIAKPPKPVATAFSYFVGPIFERIVATLYENRTLAETRDYLLPRLMSGEVRVTARHEAA